MADHVNVDDKMLNTLGYDTPEEMTDLLNIFGMTPEEFKKNPPTLQAFQARVATYVDERVRPIDAEFGKMNDPFASPSEREEALENLRDMGYTGALASRETITKLGDDIAKAGTNISFGGKVYETTEDLLSDEGVSMMVGGYLNGTIKKDMLPAALVDIIEKNRDVFTDLATEMKTEVTAFTKVQDDVKAATTGVSRDTLKLIMPGMFNADGTPKSFMTSVPTAPTAGLGKVILDPKVDPIKRTTAITIADSIQSSGVDAPIIAQLIGGMTDADMDALSNGDVRNGFTQGLKFGGKIDKVNNTFAPKAQSTDVNDVADYVEQVLGLTDLNAVLLAASETVAAGVPGDALDQANTFMSLMGGVFAPGCRLVPLWGHSIG
jgi:hypothetical protein